MAVMTTQQSEGVLLEEKLLKTTPATDKDVRNGNSEVNGHASPAEITPISDNIPNHQDEVKQEQNEGAFSANQAVSGEPNGTTKPKVDAPEVAMEDGNKDVTLDSDMPDAPVRSPTPVVQNEPISTPTALDEPAPIVLPEIPAQPSPASSAVSPGTKEDIEMDDAQVQQEQSSAADRAESTQETAISDVPATTPADEANGNAVSPRNVAIAEPASPTAPVTADTSLSEPSQTTAKVSRERDIDSEDEPVAKRAKVDAAAEEVKVKTGAEPDRMELDQPVSEVPVRNEKGEPKLLGDPTLNGNPISNFMGRQLRQILAGVKKTKAGASFKASVQDLWPGLWSDYSARIRNPVDISMMEKKLRGDLPKYTTLGEFKRDVALIVENSITFNGEQHEVTNLAKSLSDQILHRMATVPAAESVKAEKKEQAKQHPTRHTEPRATAQPAPAASPRRLSKGAAMDAPQKPVVESPAFAIPANNNGVPLIRRDSTKVDGRAKRPVKPAHPKDLVYDTKRKKKLAPEIRFCEEVLNEIRKSKYYEFNNPFMQPVDPVALNIPSYHKIVKKPMDLQTMSTRMSGGEYTSAKEFERDFDLIVKNCKLFNGEGHVIYAQALQLQGLFRKEFGKKDDWMAKHAPAAPAASFHNASPAPKDYSEDEDHESEAEPEAADPEIKATQHRLATIQKRLVEEQAKVNDMINAGTAEMADVEIAQSVVAMLQKNLMSERSKLAALQAKKPAKPKPTKPKKTNSGGNSNRKAVGGPASGFDGRPAKKAGGPKKAARRKIGTLEKEVIAAGIADLDGPVLERAIDIIKKDTGQGENDSGELELDIEQLSDEALVKLYDLAIKEFPHLRADKEKTFAAPPPPQPSAPKSKAAARNKKNKPMSKSEQERRIAQLNELRAQAGRQGSGSQEPMESIEGNGNGRASTDPAPNPNLDSDDEESSEEE